MTTEPQKLCELCHEKPVGYNGYVCDDCYLNTNFQPMSELILLGADGKKDCGLVVLSPLGMLNSEHNELAGHWSMCADGNIWVSLLKTTDALMDRATLVTAEITHRRLEGLPPVDVRELQARSPRARVRTPRVSKPREEPVVDMEFRSLRDKLRGP